MARRRMVDPHVWESEDFAALTYRQRVLHFAMFGLADDEGRGVAAIGHLRSEAFRFDDVTLAEVAADLAAIVEHISVDVYGVDGKLYYAYRNWKKWQAVDHPRPSLLPPPCTGTILSVEEVAKGTRPSRERLASDSRAPREECANDSREDRDGLATRSALSEVKGSEGKGREARAPARDPLALLAGIPGYPADPAEDQAMLNLLAAEYADVDLAQAIIAWRAWLSERKTKPKRWRLAFTNWVRVEAEKLKRETDEAAANAGPEYPLLTEPPTGRARLDLSEPDHLTALADAAKPDRGKSPW